MVKNLYAGMTPDELRGQGYVPNEDGTWSPTVERLAELLELTLKGDSEYLSTLVKVDWELGAD